MAIRGGRGGGPGGGGRSHFSGSLSRSSGRSHSSSSSSRSSIGSHRHHSGPRHYHGGGGIGIHLHGTLPPGGIFFFFAVFFIFIAIATGIGIGSCNNSLNFIEQDYTNYQSMIENSMENSAYTTWGTVTGKYEGLSGKWYIVYEIDEGYEYESFAHYTKEEVDEYKSGSKILISTEDAHVDAYTATIPFDYYNSGVENDGEYIKIKGNRTTLILITLGVSAVAVLFIFFGVKRYIKGRKEETEGSTVDTSTSTTTSTATTTKTHTKCPYCGARVSSDKGTCTQCGAGLSD